MSCLPSIIRIDGFTYQRIPIVEDGNCFFRAVAFWVYGDQEQHQYIRRLIVQHILSNWSRYKAFIVGDFSYHDRIRSMYDYGQCMKEDGRYGGSQECVATTEIFYVKIVVYSIENLGSPQVYGAMFESSFTFLFSGSQDYGHFDVIVRHDHVTLNIND